MKIELRLTEAPPKNVVPFPKVQSSAQNQTLDETTPQAHELTFQSSPIRNIVSPEVFRTWPERTQPGTPVLPEAA